MRRDPTFMVCHLGATFTGLGDTACGLGPDGPPRWSGSHAVSTFLESCASHLHGCVNKPCSDIKAFWSCLLADMLIPFLPVMEFKPPPFPSHLSPELPGAPSNLVISNISPRSATLQFRPGYDGKTSISRWIVEGQVWSP